VPLAFAQPLDSDTAQLGEAIHFTVRNDLLSGNTVIIPKGTPATGTVVRVTRGQAGVEPGRVVFQVESLTLQGRTIPLHRVAALEGVMDPAPQEARITGTLVTATLPAGTVLPAAQE
jgi:hypothetical protein